MNNHYLVVMRNSKLFNIDRYTGAANFCDRKAETAQLIDMFEQGRNGVLYSLRRLGKTGLLQHFHSKIKRNKKVVTVYLDIMATKSDVEFVNSLAQGTLQALEKKKKGVFKKALDTLANLRPSLSMDPYTQMPTLQLGITTAEEVKLSLNQLIELLAKQPYQFQIAIDEFQQIVKYKEGTTIDAAIRATFQTADNIHYIFSGSERHLLLKLFSLPDKPLYASLDMLNLDYIEAATYAKFIRKQFKKADTIITDRAIEDLLEWTNIHTFYTQYFCNKLEGKKHKKIDLFQVAEVKREILFQYEVIYINFKKLLSKNQWELLVAIAKEGQIIEYTARDFLVKYNLSQSSTKQALEALLDKSMIIDKLSLDKACYQVYDVFLWRWAERYG